MQLALALGGEGCKGAIPILCLGVVWQHSPILVTTKEVDSLSCLFTSVGGGCELCGSVN